MLSLVDRVFDRQVGVPSTERVVDNIAGQHPVGNLDVEKPHAPVVTGQAQLVLVDRFRVELAAEQINSKEGPLGGDLGFENSGRGVAIVVAQESHGGHDNLLSLVDPEDHLTVSTLSPRVQSDLGERKTLFLVHLLNSPHRLAVGTDVEGAAGA